MDGPKGGAGSGSGRPPGRKKPIDPIALRLAQERLDEGSYRKPRPARPSRAGRLGQLGRLGRMRARGEAPQEASRLVLLPALLAPLVLVGGWSLGGSAQSDDYDGLRDTLSDLAALGASHRGIMTGALVALGLAHVLTALLIRLPATLGRVLQAVGGVATVAVALLPLSSESDGLAHGFAATVAFVALALWPAFGVREDGPPVLHARPMRTATLVLALLVVWFAVALRFDAYAGLAERVAALAEALWPLIVAWLVREWGGGGGTRHVEDPPEAPAPDEPEDDPSEDDPVDDTPTDAPDVRTPEPAEPLGSR